MCAGVHGSPLFTPARSTRTVLTAGNSPRMSHHARRNISPSNATTGELASPIADVIATFSPIAGAAHSPPLGATGAGGGASDLGCRVPQAAVSPSANATTPNRVTLVIRSSPEAGRAPRAPPRKTP